MIFISSDELKYYIESRNSILTKEEYLYITSFVDIISFIKYDNVLNLFEIGTYDNYIYKIHIKENSKVKKKN